MSSENSVTQFKIYSLGLVANNKKLDSNHIEVTPIEALTMLDGEIASIPVEHEIQGQDAQDNPYTSRVTMDNALTAAWLPEGNRRSAPDVRRGERVLIWRYADTDQFYWTCLNFDLHLRKLETAVYSFSGTSDEDVDGTLPENSYSLEVSTHRGYINLRTSKQNGEHCLYVIQVNARDGRIIITDDVGNEIDLNTAETIIEFNNADGTQIHLNKQKIWMYAEDAINAEAGNSITLTAGKNIHLKTPEYRLECDTMTVVSDTNTFETPQSMFTGNVTVGGAVTFKGVGTFEGAADFMAPVRFHQPIQANGITSSAAINGPRDSI